MADDTIVVSIGNQRFIVTDAEDAFGPDLPSEYRALLIEGTANAIATLLLIQMAGGLLVPVGEPTEVLIDQRKRGLAALGVENVEHEIAIAIERLKQEGSDIHAARMSAFVY